MGDLTSAVSKQQGEKPMTRSFKKVDYEASGKQNVTIDDCLPADHLARFVVAIISMLDLSAIYAHYAPVDTGEAIPTLNAIPAELGQPPAVAMGCGYFSASNIRELAASGIEPYIATGREPHQRSWQAFLAETPAPPAEEASLIVKMVYKLRTDVGQAIYRLRKCTVEPVIDIIKEVLGFRQFSLRGLTNAAGEWCMVCLAWNLKRLHVLISD
jgi:hypothetical protein